MSKPQTEIVKRRGANFEVLGTLLIAAAIVAPFTHGWDAASAVILGGVGFVIFMIGRFL
ncbi:MAG: hypothetical protein ACKVHE_22620 [Planctomycetales bacterium]